MTQWIEQFNVLGLQSSDILRLHAQFKEMASGHATGKLEVRVLFKLLEIDHKQKFMLNIFAAFRESRNLDVFENFRDFVFSVWNFCTLSEEGLARLGYDLYDLHRSGVAYVDNLQLMIKDIYGYGYRYSETAKKLMARFAGIRMQYIDFDTFYALMCTNNLIINSILKVQKIAQDEICDGDFWRTLCAKRQKIPKETLLTLFGNVNPKYCAVKISAVSRKLPPMPELTSEQLDIIKNPDDNKIVLSPESRIAPKPPRASKIARIKAFQVSKANAKRRVMELHNQIIHKKDVVTKRLANKQQHETGPPASSLGTDMVTETTPLKAEKQESEPLDSAVSLPTSTTKTTTTTTVTTSVASQGTTSTAEAVKNNGWSLRALLTKTGSQRSIRSNESGRSNPKSTRPHSLAKILTLSKRSTGGGRVSSAKDDGALMPSRKGSRSNSVVDGLDLASPQRESTASTVSIANDVEGTETGAAGIHPQCSFTSGAVDLLGLVDEKLTIEQMALMDETAEE